MSDAVPCHICGAESNNPQHPDPTCPEHRMDQQIQELHVKLPARGAEIIRRRGLPKELRKAVDAIIDDETLDHFARLLMALEWIEEMGSSKIEAAERFGVHRKRIEVGLKRYQRSGEAFCAIHVGACPKCQGA